MIRTSATLLAASLAVVCLAACGDSPPPVAPDRPATGTTEIVLEPGEDRVAEKPAEDGAKGPLTAEDIDRQREESHTKAAKLLESFRLRAYDPVRVSGLQRLGGHITMKITAPGAEDRTGRFSFAFDAERESRQRTKVVAGAGADTLPEGSLKTAYRYAAAGFRGGYYTVVNHLPATLLSLLKSKTGQWLVYAPPDNERTSSASYVFDDQNLVVTRGNATLEARNVEYFDWKPVRGLWLLEGSRVLAHDTKTKWTYDDDHPQDIVLPKRVTVTKKGTVIDLEFHYDTVAIEPD